MFSNHRNHRQKIRAMLITGALVSFSSTAFVFAGDAGASTAKAQAKAPTQQKLVTMEQVYQGMLEAEQRRMAAGAPDSAIDNRRMREEWGIQVISTSYAASGFWLEFRFRVFDPEKAAVLFDETLKPFLESDTSHVKLGVPEAAKVGALRTTNRGRNIQAGKIYNIMFSNPGFTVKPGERVTLKVGDFKAAHMTVRGKSENLRAKLNNGIMEVPVK